MYSFNSSQASQASQASSELFTKSFSAPNSASPLTSITTSIAVANNNITTKNVNSKSDLINSFLQYIYISLRSYPPPNIITVKVNSSENINVHTICKSISNKLNIPVVDVIFGCTRYSDSTAANYANLILTDEDIEKLIENNIIPFIKPDYSTII